MRASVAALLPAVKHDACPRGRRAWAHHLLDEAPAHHDTQKV
jgi:hypothetical protein